VGSWNGTQWVVPPCDTLCEMLGDVLPADVQDDILDCVTEATEEAIRDILDPKEIKMRFEFAAEVDEVSTTVSTFNAAIYTALTQDGSSGTITVNVNGGGFGSFVNPSNWPDTTTLIVKRTTFSGAGWVEITGTYV
jgi:hypothetical protein